MIRAFMRIRNSALVLICLGLTSCGLIEMDFDTETNQVRSLTFTYDTVYVMVQDTFFLAPYIYPDSVGSKSVFWEAEKDSIVKCMNDTILANKEGWSKVMATTLINSRSDTCTVCVMPRWEVSVYEYPSDMVIYAHILIDGKVPQKNWIFGAFDADGVPRGLARPMDEDRTIYCFRVWSPFTIGDPEEANDYINLRAYNPVTLQVYDFGYSTLFTGLNDGTPSAPVQLSFSIPLPPNESLQTP